MMVPPEAVPDLMRERLGCPRCEAREGAIKPLVTAATELCESVESIIPGQPIPFAKGLFELVPRLASLRAALAPYKPASQGDPEAAREPLCPICGDTGEYDLEHRDPDGEYIGTERVRCECARKPPCPTCKGTQRVPAHPTIYITDDAEEIADAFKMAGTDPCPECARGRDSPR